MMYRPGTEPALRGRSLWRSLDELADTDEFRDRLVREFPSQAPEFLDPATRRQFLRVMGASIALAGLTGCGYKPPEAIVPYVIQPERVTPGTAKFFATAMPLSGFGTGILVETHEGRPTKIEGNPDHPGSLGVADIFMQASVLDLYDPDRSQVVMRNGRVNSWDDFLATIERLRPGLAAGKGKGLRILTGRITSPSLAGQIGSLLQDLPQARWHVHEPTDSGASRKGVSSAFGRDLDLVRHFDKADIILSLDDDFLLWGPGHLRESRDFGSRRDASATMNRLYVAEPTPTITGAMADSRLPIPARDVAAVAVAIARGIEGDVPADASHREWASQVAKDLKAHRGKSIVVAGGTQPAEVHALAHAMNAALGNLGQTITAVEPISASPAAGEEASSLKTLTRDLERGDVSLLLIIGTNPAYDAPGEANFARLLDGLNESATTTIHIGTHADETARVCHWHIPEAHFLESWGDVRAFDGTVTIQQPMIQSMYGGKTPLELVSALRGRPEPPALALVRDHWREVFGGDFDAKWRASLHDGLVAGSAAKAVEATAKPLGEMIAAVPVAVGQGMEITFRPDPTIWDGRFANNGWLQELPKPLTKLTWDNAALLSPATAKRLGVENGRIVELTFRGRTLRAAAWLDPGHADDSVSLTLGYGRTQAGRLGSGQGFNAYALRTFAEPWFGDGLAIKPTAATYALASTQQHNDMAGRDLVKAATLEDFLKKPHFAADEEKEKGHDLLSLYPEYPYEGYKWGMSINLTTCIACNACVVACVAENNISVVGKDQVLAGREMHWIRVDRYYEGKDENRPEAIYHQPVTCMHCEKAPCELVCPVNATVHDAEGLNVMVYNRCVGTRYCSNNCPYKVRRFNFLQYSDYKTESRKLQYNPDVTVRSRGVMEKCTYCVQRIVDNRIKAEQDNRRLRDGEVRTACQQTCPTSAIVFGDLNDKASAVYKAQNDPRNYNLLNELNTQPRTTYLARVNNPPPSEKG